MKTSLFSALLSPVLSAALVAVFMASAWSEGLSSHLQYQTGDKTFEAYLERSTGASKGTVVIIHDWDGLTEYEKMRANMLSGLGYDAVAIDLFGVEAKLEGRDDYRRETGALYGNRDEFRARINAAITASKSSGINTDHIIIIGYCFGGAATLEAARAGVDADGFVSFHGGLGTPEGQNYSQTTAPILLLHGSADPVSGMDDLASLLNQLEEAKVPHDAEVYGGARHSFTVSGSRDYDQAADAKAWDALVRFLNKLNEG